MSRTKKRLLFIWHAVFVLTVLFLLLKCRYGFAYSDEAFYLSIPWRIVRGDSLLLQEWHPSQLANFLTVPLMRLYLMIFGTMEGAILRFRVIFTLAWSLASYFYYLRLRKMSLYGSMAASLAILVYVPFGMMALSYNTLGIMMMVNAGVMVSTNIDRHWGWDCLAGLFFAGAVLCCPFLVVGYVLLTIAAFIMAFGRKRKEFLTFWLRFSGGCGILLIVFCMALLSRGTPDAFLRSFSELLSDPEHPQTGLIAKTLGYFQNIYTSNKYILPCAATALFSWLFLRRKEKCLGFLIVCGTCLITLCGYWNTYLNFLLFPVNILGLYCGMSLKHDKQAGSIFVGLWIPGLLYTYCLNYSSSQQFYAISSASSVMMVASLVLISLYLEKEFSKNLELNWWQLGSALLFLVLFIPLSHLPALWSVLAVAGLIAALLFFFRKESNCKKKIPGRFAAAAVALLLLCVQLGREYMLRWNFSYGEPSFPLLNTQIQTGLEKGVRTSAGQAESYAVLEADARIIRDNPEIKNLLILAEDDVPIMYLDADKDIASYSAWLFRIDENIIQRLDRYYEQNPAKYPDAVYLYLYKGFESYKQRYLAQGYSEHIMPSGAYLLLR